MELLTCFSFVSQNNITIFPPLYQYQKPNPAKEAIPIPRVHITIFLKSRLVSPPLVRWKNEGLITSMLMRKRIGTAIATISSREIIFVELFPSISSIALCKVSILSLCLSVDIEIWSLHKDVDRISIKKICWVGVVVKDAPNISDVCSHFCIGLVES
jgi:hypothetical protein